MMAGILTACVEVKTLYRSANMVITKTGAELTVKDQFSGEEYRFRIIRHKGERRLLVSSGDMHIESAHGLLFVTVRGESVVVGRRISLQRWKAAQMRGNAFICPFMRGVVL